MDGFRLRHPRMAAARPRARSVTYLTVFNAVANVKKFRRGVRPWVQWAPGVGSQPKMIASHCTTLGARPGCGPKPRSGHWPGTQSGVTPDLLAW